MTRWNPSASLSRREQYLVGRMTRTGKLFAFLRNHRDELFDDGFQAELETKTWHPDVVLLDLLMPNEDGFAYLRKIRSDSETNKTRVIVLSNLSGSDVLEQVKKYGVTEYIIKANSTPEKILEKIKVASS